MASNSTLCVHAGAVRRSVAELQGLHTPERTATWTPVPHHELVTGLHATLAARGVIVKREEYATLARDARLFGVMDLLAPAYSEDGGIGLALGLRASNDKSMAIKVVAAARVFVCDNMSMAGHGGSVCLRAIHSANLRLDNVIPPAIELFMDRAGVWRADLGRMQGLEIGDGRAKELIVDAFRQGDCLPTIRFGDVARLYFDDEEQRGKFPDRTLWALQNAFTEAVKRCRPAAQFSYGERIGRYFAKTLHRLDPDAPKPAVFDLAGANVVERTGYDGNRQIDVELAEEPVSGPLVPRDGLGTDGATAGPAPAAGHAPAAGDAFPASPARAEDEEDDEIDDEMDEDFDDDEDEDDEQLEDEFDDDDEDYEPSDAEEEAKREDWEEVWGSGN